MTGVEIGAIITLVGTILAFIFKLIMREWERQALEEKRLKEEAERAVERTKENQNKESDINSSIDKQREALEKWEKSSQ